MRVQVETSLRLSNLNRTTDLSSSGCHHRWFGWKGDRKKRRGVLDSVLTVSKQPVRKEKLYPDIVISFTNDDFLSEAIKPHEGALVITAQVSPVDMRRIMIDNNSSVDILYSYAYQRLDVEGRKMEVGQESLLYGFSNDLVLVLGTIELSVTFGTATQQVQIDIKFFVVQVDSAYITILGQTTLVTLQAVTSMPHFKIKFPMLNGIGEVKGIWTSPEGVITTL